MIPIAPTPSTVEIAQGVTVVLMYGIPKTREEALRRVEACFGNPETLSPLVRALEWIDAKRILQKA